MDFMDIIINSAMGVDFNYKLLFRYKSSYTCSVYVFNILCVSVYLAHTCVCRCLARCACVSLCACACVCKSEHKMYIIPFCTLRS